MKKLFSIWIILFLGLGMTIAFADSHEETSEPEPEPTNDDSTRNENIDELTQELEDINNQLG